MPTDRDREDRRRAEDRLAASYGWPEAADPSGRRLGCAVVLLVEAATILAVVFGTALLLGWRP